MSLFGACNAIIIDPELQSRARLRQAARSVEAFGKVQMLSSLREARPKFEHLEEDERQRWDIVFISDEIARKDTEQFIGDVRELDAGVGCAFVLVIRGEQDSATVAKSVVKGFDGFLLEPYSISALLEITEIAERVKLEAMHKRVRAATSLVVKTLAKEVDRLAALRSLGEPAQISKGALNAKQVISELDEEARNCFFDVVLDMFPKLPPPPQVAYSGISERVKNMLTRKLKKKTAEQLGEEISKEEQMLKEVVSE